MLLQQVHFYHGDQKSEKDRLYGAGRQNTGAVDISGKQAGQAEEKKGGVLFMGDLLPGGFDPIAQKRETARKKAMQIVSDTFANEKKMDSDLKERAAHAKKLRSEKAQANSQIRQLDEEIEQLRAQSQNAGADAAEEYQMRIQELESYKQPYERAVLVSEYGYKDQAGIQEEYAVIRGTQLERLKKDPMREASHEAEEILKEASDEIVGMLAEEAKDHIEQKQQEEQEKAEEKREEKIEEQEKVEEVRERREELEELLYPEQAEKKPERPQESEIMTGDILTESLLKMDALQGDFKREIQGIAQKMNLVAEDFKGIRIDDSV